MKNTVTSLLIIYLLTSCSNNLRNYYYDLSTLQESVYYKYEFENKEALPHFWKLTGNPNANTLVTNAFDNTKNQVEHFKEKYTENGSQLIEFTFLEDNDSILTDIQSNNVFSWSKNEDYEYKVVTQKESNNSSFSKSREFIGFERVDCLGKSHKAAKFKSNYTYHELEINQVYKYWQYDYYTKAHGFVKFERSYPDGETETLILTEILSQEEWEKAKTSETK